MNIWYQNRPLLSLQPATSEIAGTITAVPNGTVIVHENGTVLSVVPDGSFDARPSGTAGPYELCTVDGSINTLNYGQNGCPMKIAYRAR